MTFLQDASYGLRLMLRRPGFTAVILLSLAAAVGASGAVFSVINAFVLRDLPVRDPHQLVEFLSRYPGEPRMYSFGWSDYEHYRDHNRSFSEIIATAPARFEIRTTASATETLVGEYAVGDFFHALGVRPAIGRLIGRDDDRVDAGDPAVAVLSWPYWRSHFNLDPSAIGTRIVVNGVPVTVVGVTSRDFFGLQLGRTPAVWVPSELARRPGSSPPPTAMLMVGRLRPGVSLNQARAEMRTLDRVRLERMAVKDPAWLEARIELEPAAAGLTSLRDQFGNQLLVLMATVSVLTLVACLNVATMLAARGAARRHELAVRVALGAGRWRVARQLFTEALLLATAGTALGLLLANAGGYALLRALPVDSRSAIRLDEVTLSMDWRILALATGATALAASLFALAPAWGAFRSEAAGDGTLRHRGAETPARRFYEHTLVAIQLAFALVLGSAAVMLVTHVAQLRTHGAGFSADSVLLMTVEPQGPKQPPDVLMRTYQALLERIRTLPGVGSATLAAITPIQGGAASQFMRVEGIDEPAESRRRVSLNWVAPQYFETVRTPLIAGRDFVNDDEGGSPVAIVNQRLARHYFGEANPIGRRFTLERGTESYEIVGVAADAKYASLHEPAPPTVYLHAFQGLRGRVSQFAIRIETDLDAVAPAVRRVVTENPWGLSVGKLTTLRAQVDASIVTERLLGNLSSLLAALGTVLVAIGLYGLLALTVASRRREIGIRMVLGATRGDVMRMVLRDGALMWIVGVGVGIPLAFWLRGVAATLIPDFNAGVAAPISTAVLLITAVALAAAWLPARSASRVHPAEALRDR